MKYTAQSRYEGSETMIFSHGLNTPHINLAIQSCSFLMARSLIVNGAWGNEYLRRCIAMMIREF